MPPDEPAQDPARSSGSIASGAMRPPAGQIRRDRRLVSRAYAPLTALAFTGVPMRPVLPISTIRMP